MTELEALRKVADAAREWKSARTTLSAEHPRTYQTNRRVTAAQEVLDKAVDHAQPEPARREGEG